MLTTLRKAAGTWLAKLLLVLLVLSFAVWGISGQIVGGTGNSVLTAGETEVSILDYRLAYDRQISVLSQQFGTRISREQARAFGIDQQVLAQLAAGAVLDEQAREMGLGVSRDRLAELTAEDPAFRGPNGQFDRRQFEFVLRQVGMRPEDYLRNREQLSIREQLIEAAADGVAAPGAFLKAVALYEGEDRTVEYVVIPRAEVEPVPDPDPEALQAWFEDRKADYGAPEYRKFSYVKLQPEDIANPGAVSNDEIAAYYEEHKDSFTTPERRTIEQIVFADREAAEAALASIRSGATFEDVMAAEEKSAEDVRLGTFARGEVADPAIAEAAFSLSANEVSGVVDGRFGPILLRVTEIEPEVVKPLGETSDEIRQELALAEANRILLDVHDAYEDARAAGDTMREAAAKQQLDVVTVDAVDRSGRDPQGDVLATLPESNRLLQEVFETETGIENPPLAMSGDGFVFYEVDEVIPARERDLDEVRDAVVADWKQAEAAARLSALAAEKEKAARDGTALDEIAQSLDTTREIKRGLSRDSEDADFGDAGVEAVFSVPKGGIGSFANAQGDARILFRVTEVMAPAAAGAESLPPEDRETFGQAYSSDLLDQLVADLQEKYEIRVNQRAIDQALSF